jgi:hypothetical protein
MAFEVEVTSDHRAGFRVKGPRSRDHKTWVATCVPLTGSARVTENIEIYN